MQESCGISLQLLGRFVLAVKDGTEIRISARKSRALIAYLALQPGMTASREQLATLLWGDRSDELARQNLRQCLVSLRRELPPAVAELLILADDSVGLRDSDIAIDVRDLLTFAGETGHCPLKRAAELYRGPFLQGLNIDAESFTEWQQAERARLEETAARVFTACVAHADQAGEGHGAVQAAAGLIAIDPLREDWQRLALRMAARYEGREVALDRARKLVALIKSELDATIEPATAALIEEIKSGAIVAVTTGRPTAPSTSWREGDEGGIGDSTADAADAAVQPETLAAPVAAAIASAGRVAWGVRPFNVMSAAIAAALVMLVGGVWLVAQNHVDVTSFGPAVAQTATLPRATDASWSSPVPRLKGAVNQSALEARGVTPIMVWPFAAAGEAGEADLGFADALTDDLITNLSRFPALRVISRLTVVAYRGRNRNAAEVGTELGVRYVVEGSVRQRDGVVRINVALVDATNGLELWGDRFQRSEADQASIQDEIVIRLARELEIEVTSALSRQSRAPQDTGIRELLAKGAVAQLRGPAAENIAEARSYFQAALMREPTLVPALVGIAAQELMGSVNNILDSKTSTAHAAALLGRAHELDPSSPQVEYSTGMLHKARREYAAALQSFYRVLEVNPSHTPAYAQIASNLTMLGRSQEAMESINYAMRLSPQDPMMGIWTLIAGGAELENGHYGAAADWFRRSIALVPNNPNTHRSLAAAYALLGDKEGAARHMSQYRRLSTLAETQRARELRGIDNDTVPTGRRLRAGLRLAYALAP